MNNEEQANPNKQKDDGITSGLILIAVGVIFLVMQFGGFYIHNWWALFILIPVVVSWNQAIRKSIEAGEIKEESKRLPFRSLFYYWGQRIRTSTYCSRDSCPTIRRAPTTAAKILPR